MHVWDADQGVASSIQAQSHLFLEIDHEIILEELNSSCFCLNPNVCMIENCIVCTDLK